MKTWPDNARSISRTFSGLGSDLETRDLDRDGLGGVKGGIHASGGERGGPGGHHKDHRRLAASSHSNVVKENRHGHVVFLHPAASDWRGTTASQMDHASSPLQSAGGA